MGRPHSLQWRHGHADANRSRFCEPEPVSPAAQLRRRARGYDEPPDEDLIVTNRFGRPVLQTDFHQKWRKAVKQAGLSERTRFHDLKHFYTTTLGGSGEHDPKTVQALSRHAKFSETWDTYAHPPLAVEEVTVTVFGTAFSHIDTPAGASRVTEQAPSSAWPQVRVLPGAPVSALPPGGLFCCSGPVTVDAMKPRTPS
ncbi:tyrosine-type recombinase/integrase [Streptomyces sp. NPDC005303]|uniref:tyrosine-type recombinase/integrase n=1 Tax=Streptomyces sp. NPDC005303 TaxID=3155713 RepID=UPI0033A348E9